MKLVFITTQTAYELDIFRFRKCGIFSDISGHMYDARRVKRARRRCAAKLKALLAGFAMLDANRGYLVRYSACA